MIKSFSLYFHLGPGKVHSCLKSVAVQKILKFALDSGIHVADQIASGILKKKNEASKL